MLHNDEKSEGDLVTGRGMLEAYLAAFNAGDSAAYASFYAPSVVLVNGAGDELRGAAAIVAFYDSLKARMRRQIELLEQVEGRDCLAAALQSRFEIIADGTAFAGRQLDAGDSVLLRSIALYEIENGRFARIQARTLDREIARAGKPR